MPLFSAGSHSSSLVGVNQLEGISSKIHRELMVKSTK